MLQSKLVRKIKNIIPLNLKVAIIKVYVRSQYYIYKVFPKPLAYTDKSKRVAYILFVTDYANLGDHAMSQTQAELIKETLPEWNVVEIRVNDVIKVLWTMKRQVRSNDLITLKGGGNIGIEYFREEMYRRILLKEIKKCKIICFPQTIYFDNSRRALKEFRRTVDIYSSNSKLVVYLRDHYSYDIALKSFQGIDIRFIPDVVFFKKGLELYKAKAEYVLVCLREDVERRIADSQRGHIIKMAEEYDTTVKEVDTIRYYDIYPEQREAELDKIFEVFGKAKYVITDRLHGLVFCAKMGIPCIVLDNYNYKVRGTYEVVSDLDYLVYCDDYKNIEKAIRIVRNIDRDSAKFNCAFDVFLNQVYKDLECE